MHLCALNEETYFSYNLSTIENKIELYHLCTMYIIAESLKFNPRYVTIIASAVFKWICSPLTITVTNTGCFKCFFVKSLHVFFDKSLYVFFVKSLYVFFRQIVVCFFRQIVRLKESKRIQGKKRKGFLFQGWFGNDYWFLWKSHPTFDLISKNLSCNTLYIGRMTNCRSKYRYRYIIK